MEEKKKNLLKYTIFAAVLLAAAAAFLYFTGQFGVSASDLESDARKNQKIDETWTAECSSGRSVSAMLFYDEVLGEYKTSIYMDPDDRPFGYYFISGGCTNAENEGIVEYRISGCDERIYMSMNLQQASLMVVDNGTEVKEIELDSEKPFVRVMPESAGSVIFYDAGKNQLKVLESMIP